MSASRQTLVGTTGGNGPAFRCHRTLHLVKGGRGRGRNINVFTLFSLSNTAKAKEEFCEARKLTSSFARFYLIFQKTDEDDDDDDDTSFPQGDAFK